MGRVEAGVEHRHIPPQHAFEPALGLHAIERIALAAGGKAAQIELPHQLAEVGLGGIGERSFVGSGAQGDLLLAVEALACIAHADAGKFEAVQEEGQLGAAANLSFDQGDHVRGK